MLNALFQKFVLQVIFFPFSQDNVYYSIGQLLAIGVMQGAAGLHLFSPSTFNYIIRGTCACDIIPGIEEIPDESIREITHKVLNVLL